MTNYDVLRRGKKVGTVNVTSDGVLVLEDKEDLKDIIAEMDSSIHEASDAHRIFGLGAAKARSVTLLRVELDEAGYELSPAY